MLSIAYSFYKTGKAALPPNIQYPTDDTVNLPSPGETFRRTQDPASYWMIVIFVVLLGSVLVGFGVSRIFN